MFSARKANKCAHELINNEFCKNCGAIYFKDVNFLNNLYNNIIL